MEMKLSFYKLESRAPFQHPVGRLIIRSRSRDICIQNCLIALKFDRYLGSIAVDVPVKFQSDTNISTSDLAPWRLMISWSHDQTSYRILKAGPEAVTMVTQGHGFAESVITKTRVQNVQYLVCVKVLYIFKVLQIFKCFICISTNICQSKSEKCQQSCDCLVWRPCGISPNKDHGHTSHE